MAEEESYNRDEKRLLLDPSNDRLSNLPDSVIHHLLSFLDTKFAVQTCVLSRFWKPIWKQTPVLNFDRRSFQDYLDYRRYVEEVLSLRNQVTVDGVYYIDNVADAGKREASLLALKVIQYAFSHGVQRLALDLEFDVTMTDCCTFSELFGSNSGVLKSLLLQGIDIDAGFQLSGFRLLTDLELIGCNLFSGDHELYDPFAGFPCLKNLVLDTYHNGKPDGDDFEFERFRISGPELVRLRLVCVERCKIEIYAPKLESLTLWKFQEVKEFSEMILPSLQHADIWVPTTDEFLVEDENEFFDSLFCSFRSVQSLTLRYGTVESLCRISEFLEQRPSPFTRLQNLYLELESDEVPRNVVSYFVKGSADSSIKVLKEEDGVLVSVPIEIY